MLQLKTPKIFFDLCSGAAHINKLNNETWNLLTYRIFNYNPSVRITTYLLTILILCELIVYMGGHTYSLVRFLKNFGKFTYSQSFYQKSAKGKSPKKYFYLFHFAGNVWPGFCNVFSYLISQHYTYDAKATSK